jgi:hypothetical protein
VSASEQSSVEGASSPVRIELGGGTLTYRLAAGPSGAHSLPLPESDALVPYLAYDAYAEVSGIPVGRPVSLLLVPNEHTPTPHVAAGPFATNAHVERTWNEARRRLSSGALHGFAALDPPFVAIAAPDQPLRHPPLTYCRKRRVYFSPVCPECLGPLVTCRDDALLHRLYLPAHGESLARFLYCRSCARTASTVTMYTYELREVRHAESVRVRRRGELYRDLSPQIKGTPTRVPAGHPCFACEHRETCYPVAGGAAPIPAEEHLVAIAFYEFEFLPVERLPLDFDAAARVLGGGDWPIPAAPAPTRGDARATGSFLFRGDGGGLFELEVLYLKLQAFAELIGGALELHANGRPHLALSHSRVRARADALGEGRPAAWGVHLKLRDLVSAALGESPAIEARAPRVWSPPYQTTPSYLPEAARTPSVERLWMTLRAAAVSPVDEGTVSIEAQLGIDDFTVPTLGRHDVLQLELPVPGSSPIVAVGSAVSGDERLIRFEGQVLGADPATAARLQREGIPPGRTGVTVTRVLHAPVDVYALGIIFVRLLFATDADAAGVTSLDALREAALSIADAARGGGHAPDVAMLCRQAGVPSSPVDILYRAADRSAAQGAVPRDLWSDVLSLAIRMASNVKGFSVCESIDDYPREDPAEPLREVSHELEGLLRRTQVALLGTGGRNDVVLRALDDYLDDYHESRAGEEGETSTTGFKTIVGRRPR